ncbi:phage holin family protein [Laribacter hongkongensis]|uniref:phage holin family protein n=1 Tax=Laribacter hongkongensis TaxID=168471 RepID=UPI001EFD2963|nr:phage holin family protein [Laribacter hongkongensis]MCG8993691.1 phage holin family protein [Laribacter hongkongensis]MCG9002837.1 phage holin family protein [Laribacter hongkongensis]MCG9008953.1 phage holin family protein [Laribacter hongkongensis]MCG9018302.1 phage holin family protein [Laribacter hongkongensis]
MELNEAANAAKNPASYSVITYCWVVALSLLGGISGAVRRAREDGRVTLLEIVGELSISAFAGVMTFYLCEWSGTDQLLSAAFVGMSGHMGSRAISGLEKVWAKRMGFDVPADSPGQS